MLPAPDSPSPRIKKKPLKPRNISAAEQEEILLIAHQAYLKPISDTNQLECVNTHAHVIQAFKRRELSYFINEDDKITRIDKYNIAQLIKQALARYPVNISLEKPRNWKAAAEQFNTSRVLLKKLWGLKELIVASPFNDESGSPPTVGKMAAQLFKKLTTGSDKPLRIAIGGGRTIRDMAVWLTPSQEPLIFSATNYATRISDEEVYDSSYLAMAIHWLFSKSVARIVSMPPLPSNDITEAARWHSKIFNANPDIVRLFQENLEPDIVFVGTGNFAENSPSISRVYRHLGIDYKKLMKMNPRPVGDINLCFFDKAGNDITSDILKENLKGQLTKEELEAGSLLQDGANCHPFLIGMNIACLKNLVDSGKTVVLVAGEGGSKANAIHACLRAGIVNALVTDAATMEILTKKGRP